MHTKRAFHLVHKWVLLPDSLPLFPFMQLLQHLELETMQLEAFLEWKQLEAVYWQWMVIKVILITLTGSWPLTKTQNLQRLKAKTYRDHANAVRHLLDSTWEKEKRAW